MKEYFNWEGVNHAGNYYDCHDDTFLFMNVTLKKQIGNFPIGTKFEDVIFRLKDNTVEFYKVGDKNPTIMNFEIKIGAL